jgi:hypothetical protein
MAKRFGLRPFEQRCIFLSLIQSSCAALATVGKQAAAVYIKDCLSEQRQRELRQGILQFKDPASAPATPLPPGQTLANPAPSPSPKTPPLLAQRAVAADESEADSSSEEELLVLSEWSKAEATVLGRFGLNRTGRTEPNRSNRTPSPRHKNLRFCISLFALSPSYFTILCTNFVYNGSVSRAVSFVCDNFSKTARHRFNIPSNKGT